jgi:repressor LexA
MILSDNINRLMTEANVSNVQLGKELEISAEAIRSWRNGTKIPTVDKLAKLASYFSVSLDELMGKPLHTEQASVALPLVGMISAGPFEILNEDQWDEKRTVQARLLADRPKRECVAMEVMGDSMEPYLLEGDVLVVHRQNYAVNGNIIVVYDPSLNGYTVKRYKQNGDKVILEPYNGHYAPMVYNNPKEQELRLYGVCVGLERKLV